LTLGFKIKVLSIEQHQGLQNSNVDKFMKKKL
jgi:hypothetical protein